MVYAPHRRRSHGVFARPSSLGRLPGAMGLELDSRPERDVIERVLIAGRATLSWVATFVGIRNPELATLHLSQHGASPFEVFGPYAKSAAAELRSAAVLLADDPEDDADARDLPAKQEAAKAPRSAAPAGHKIRDDHVDFVVKRETATVSLPLKNVNRGEGIVACLGATLNEIEGHPAKKFSRPPDMRAAAASNADTPRKAKISHAKDVEKLEPVADDISTDSATVDAVTIAGRLRSIIHEKP